MKAAIVVAPKVSKKSIKAMTNALCQIMHCAKKAERSDETTQVAINALSKSASVDNMSISNNVLTVK